MSESDEVDSKFKEVFPEFLTDKGTPLSPYIDIFEEGWAAGEISTEQRVNESKRLLRELVDELGKFYDDYPDIALKAERFLKEGKDNAED